MNPDAIHLILDCFYAAFIYPFQGEPVLSAMLVFGNLPESSVYFSALLGGMLGLLANYIAGFFLYLFLRLHLENSDKAMERYASIRRFFICYLLWLLLFSGFGYANITSGATIASKLWATFGPLLGTLSAVVISFLSGFLKVPLWKFLAFCLVGKGAYYYYLIYY